MICRPTLKVLSFLPSDTVDRTVRAVLAEARTAESTESRIETLSRLRLDDLEHPLLDNARTRFGNGRPDIHKEATAAANETIYEVRSRAGAAWRGAMWAPKEMAWLVFADKHDRFHSTVASYVERATSSWKPTALDELLSRRETAHRDLFDWKCATLAAVLGEFHRQVFEGDAPTPLTIKDLSGRTATVSISLEHDPPSGNACEAHESLSLIDFQMRLTTPDHALLKQLTALILRLPDGVSDMSPVFLSDGTLLLSITVSHARLAQLAAELSGPTDTAALPEGTGAPLTAHLAPKAAIVKGVVNGDAIRGLCGKWFVPTQAAPQALPVCVECEQIHPVAQALNDMLHRRG